MMYPAPECLTFQSRAICCARNVAAGGMDQANHAAAPESTHQKDPECGLPQQMGQARQTRPGDHCWRTRLGANPL